MERWLLDTNLIVYLLDPDQATDRKLRTHVRRLFEEAASGAVILVVTPPVVMETLFVLKGFGVEPKDAAGLLEHVLALDGVECEEETHVLYALSQVSRTIDFVDAYLASRSQTDAHGVASNDRNMRRLNARLADWTSPHSTM